MALCVFACAIVVAGGVTLAERALDADIAITPRVAAAPFELIFPIAKTNFEKATAFLSQSIGPPALHYQLSIFCAGLLVLAVQIKFAVDFFLRRN